MPAVRLSEVSLTYGERVLLNAVDLEVTSGDRIALTGVNGSGKSTLMRMLAGITAPDTGAASRDRGTRVSYLPQYGLRHQGRSLFEEADTAFREMEALVTRMREIEQVLGRGGEAPEGLLEEYGHLQDEVIDSNYYHRRETVERVLSGLGFSHSELERETSTFSAGWQMRIALAKVLLEHPDILLLDEPTNYLDLEARTWLEEYLQKFRGGIVVVSHDRYFLDVSCTSVAEIYLGRLIRRSGNFSAYERERSRELEAVIKAYHLQQREIERIEAFIRRFRYQASRARLVQDRIRYLEKLERIEIPPGLKSIHFSFPKPPHSGRVTVTAAGVTKAYGDERVLDGFSLELARGEKLVVVGPNGSGKSTLLRILGDREKADSGEVRFGKDVRIGYFSQDDVDTLDRNKTVYETVEAVAGMEQIPQLRGLLGAFLFRGDDIDKPVAVLSGGEASRLALLTMLLEPVNLLVLDEPTNHLDMTSKDVLLEAVRGFTGTVVFVSHDRYFIENLATRVLDLTNRRPRLYFGDYAYYLWRRDQAEEPGDTPASAPPREATPSPEPLVAEPAAHRAAHGRAAERHVAPGVVLVKKQSVLERQEAKQRKAALARLEREEARVVDALGQVQQERASLESSMTRPETYRDADRMREAKRRLVEIEQEERLLTQRWEAVEGERAELSGE